VDEVEDRVWLIKTARVIPENELWLHSDSATGRLQRAVEWAEKNPPAESDLGRLGKKLRKRRY